MAFCIVLAPLWEIFGRQNFGGFHNWPNIRENENCKLGILELVVLYHVTVASIRENFIGIFSFLEPSAKILSHEISHYTVCSVLVLIEL